MVRPADFDQVMQRAEFVPQAIFDRPVSYFAEVLEVKVSEGHDDLDYYQGAAFLLDEFIPAAVMHYRGHPTGTTTLYLPFEVADPKLISAIVNMVVRAFDIPAGAVFWQRQPDGEVLAG